MAAVLPLLIPLAVEVPALAALGGLAALLVGLVAYEVIRFGEARERLRRKLLHGEANVQTPVTSAQRDGSPVR